MVNILIHLNSLIIIYFLVMALSYSILLILSFPVVIRRFEETAYGNLADLMRGEQALAISVIIPAYNEERRILNAVYSVLNSDYKNVHIIISCDGPTDNTLKILMETFNLYEIPMMLKHTIKTADVKRYFTSAEHPNITVIEKENGHVADAVNAGLNICRTPIYMTLDADTVLKPKAISRLLFTYLSNPSCILVSGAVYVLNGNEISEGKFVREPRVSKQSVVIFQCNEYLSSFLFGRSGWNWFGGALCYSGAFMMLDTNVVVAAGGYDRGNFSHDAEITLKLHRYMRDYRRHYKICYNPSAMAWTEVPASLKALWRQRNAWQRGLLCSFDKHKRLGLPYRYGRVSFFSFPFYILFEVFGPLVEFTAYSVALLEFFIGMLGGSLLLFITIAWAYFVFLMISSILLNLLTSNIYRHKMDIFRLFFFSILNPLGFRQFIVLSNVWGTIQYCWNRLKGRQL